jgi:hypothetical protein
MGGIHERRFMAASRLIVDGRSSTHCCPSTLPKAAVQTA